MSGDRHEGAVSAPAGRAALARRVRERLGPVRSLGDWPPVSIVVVNRDGEDHLRLLLPRLVSATDYPRLELVLIDNASEDGSIEFAQSLRLPFPLTIVENEANLSFSDANNDGADRAGFDWLLFLNNDVEPFEPGWLKELVACLEGEGATAAGATLVHGENYRGSSRADYVIQHRGVEFAQEAGRLVPLKSGEGEDLRDCDLTDVRTPALTAACLLVRRADFERVGGFTPGFEWGWEDVDFGLKLASGGDRLLCSGRSLLIHHESSTRFNKGQEWRRRTKANNQRLLLERWAPQLRREYMLDRLSTVDFWTDGRPPHLAIALSGQPDHDSAARDLADAIEELGWRVSLIKPSADSWGEAPIDTDFVLVTDPSYAASLPPGATRIAWVNDQLENWTAAAMLRRAELTLVTHLSATPSLEAVGVAPLLFDGAADAARLLGLLRQRAERLRFCIKLSRDWELEAAALALRRSLERRGHACSIQLADEWLLLGGLTADVAITVGAPGDYIGSSAQVNVLWAPSPSRPTEYDGWDLILVPDKAAAASFAPKTPTTVAPLDLDASADAAEPLLELVAKVTARDGIPSRVAAQV